MNVSKRLALFVSGGIGLVIPSIFAWDIYAHNLKVSIATWGMVLLLDLLGLVLAYKAGNERPYIQWGWLIAAILIVLAIMLNERTLDWGWVETSALVCCVIAIWLWLTRSAKWGLWFYMVAAYISLVPQVIEYWHAPQPESLYLWLGTVVGCGLAIVGAEKRDFGNTFVAYGAGILNLFIAVLVLR